MYALMKKCALIRNVHLKTQVYGTLRSCVAIIKAMISREILYQFS